MNSKSTHVVHVHPNKSGGPVALQRTYTRSARSHALKSAASVRASHGALLSAWHTAQARPHAMLRGYLRCGARVFQHEPVITC